MQIPFFTALEGAERILLSGCGGGFDIVSGLPLYVWLRAQGKQVFLGNLSFAQLGLAWHEKLGPAGWVVDQTSELMDDFPERHLVDWLALRGDDPMVVGFDKTGVTHLKQSYDAVIDRHAIDTVILVDGGTDSVIKGNEALLGTVEEDAASIAAVRQLACPRKFLVCLGFGIDQFLGICHYSFLENTAELIRADGYLGCVSVTDGTAEADAFQDAVGFLNTRQPSHPSIVCNSIASAIRGEFGDHHGTRSTAGSKLFINALMALYWCYDLQAVAKGMGFHAAIANTTTFRELETAIGLYHARVVQREWKSLPL